MPCLFHHWGAHPLWLNLKHQPFDLFPVLYKQELDVLTLRAEVQTLRLKLKGELKHCLSLLILLCAIVVLQYISDLSSRLYMQ